MKPLCIDLYCGLGGWAEGFLSEGYQVRGFDIEAHRYPKRVMNLDGDSSKLMSGKDKHGNTLMNRAHEQVYGFHRAPLTGEWEEYPAELIIRDVRSIHGSEFKEAACTVGSSPCQEFSYRAMPWSRAKALPPPYLGIELFNAQFRIQREACEAAGRYIPMVVENVRGAQKWVGRAAWHYGSYYLWGDVPALMPMTLQLKAPGKNWNEWKDWDGTEENKPASVRPWGDAAVKTIGHANILDGHTHTRHLTNQRESDAVKRVTIGGTYAERKAKGDTLITTGSKSASRKAASALIAKIPYALASHIARTFAAAHREGERA